MHLASPSTVPSLWVAFALAAASSELRAAFIAPGPDVIVGDIHDLASFGAVGDIHAFSIGTTSCNVGSAELNWIEDTADHPVIAQNVYRIHGGRIQQIGMSWLKHGFFALQGSLCGACTPATDSSRLGIGCSDPYSAALNGQQNILGPRSEVNASKGLFPFPPRLTPPVSDRTSRRIQIPGAALDPVNNQGARYYAEAQYVAADDAQAGNDDNNASFREVRFAKSGASYNIQFAGTPTIQAKAAVFAWQDQDPAVRVFVVDVDGRILVAVKQSQLDARTHTEIAVHNLTSDRAVGAVSLLYTGPTTMENSGTAHPQYHSGEQWSATPWKSTREANSITWSTESFEDNPNASAIRWSTLHNFWTDSSTPPSSIVLKLFKPGPDLPKPIVLVDETASHQARQVWGSAPPDIEFSPVIPSTSKLFSVHIAPRVPRGIKHYRSTVEFIQLSASPSAEDPSAWNVRVNAMANAPAGPYEGLLILETGLPQDAAVQVRVFGEIPARFGESK
jgi:hypothetical protein